MLWTAEKVKEMEKKGRGEGRVKKEKREKEEFIFPPILH